MSDLRPLPSKAAARLARLDQRLAAAYGTPEASLGNRTDPLEEAVYIILSFQTDVARSKLVWESLRQTFPSWEAVEHATQNELAAVLYQGGLHHQKARTIQALLRAVRDQFGKLSLESLAALDDQAAEKLLLRLPGLSWKGARCVLLYSLNRNVLPVDVNTFRILRRLGIIPPTSVYRRRTLHDRIQDAVPGARRREFHVNLVVHGQVTCTPMNPHCAVCVVRTNCAERRVRQRAGQTDNDSRHARSLRGVDLRQGAEPQ